MRTFPGSIAGWAAVVLAFACSAHAAAAKVHVIAFGKATSVPWTFSDDGHPTQILKVRPLVVDGRVKEYAVGPTHEVTERLFVMRRAFRVNDSLPEETGAPRWQWQRGGWLLVDRVTGRVSPVNLPEFDVFYSAVSWYRDYAAYCGVSDDGKKIYAVVAQFGRRKPVLKKVLTNDKPLDDSAPDSACATPAWQRAPVRVSFEVAGQPKETFAVRGHVADVVSSDEEEEEAGK